MNPPLRWSPGAQVAWRALRSKHDVDGTVWVGWMLTAIAMETMPGSCALGRALRDPSVWGHLREHIAGHLGPGPQGTGFNFALFELGVEDRARAEGSRTVGERHIAAALPDGDQGLSGYGIKRDVLIAAVRELELGRGFEPGEIRGRWHGLIDANVVAHHRDIEAIDWSRLTGQTENTIWVSTVLLDELDTLAYQERRSRAWRRAATFNRWIRPLLAASMESGGTRLKNGAQLRVWNPPQLTGSPDSMHLDVAELLLAHGVPIRIVTGDNGMLARAIATGIETFDFSSQLLPAVDAVGDQAAL